MNEPKYPHVTVKLIEEDGNIFSLMGQVDRSLRKAKVPTTEINEFTNRIFEAQSYNEALTIITETVNVI